MKNIDRFKIKRNKSVITGRRNLENLYTIKNFPVFIGATNNSIDKDVFADLKFMICRDSGIVQLGEVLDPKIVYPEYHSEALGGIWKEHHLKFIDFINIFKPSSVLEIGGSNGFIAKNYIKKEDVDKWIIVDPNPKIESSKKIKVLKSIFDSSFKIDDEIDTVIHSHTLEHIYEPRDFLDSISFILPEKGLNIFSVPNLYSYLKNKQSNVLNFEHTIFLTEYFIDQLLMMYGFKILKKKYFRDHSIFYATQKVSDKTFSYKGKNLHKAYTVKFNKYFDYYLKLIDRYNRKINKFDGEVYVFGAHVFSQFLISLGLSNSIYGVLDNSKIKQNKRLYGTSLKIFSPEKIKGGRKKAVILRAGIYQDEIRNQLLNINESVAIWE